MDAVKDENELIAQSLAGEPEAFGRIVAKYQSQVCSVAYSATGDVGLSEDLAQEAFLVAWRKLANLRDRGKLGAWLCGIVRNIARDAMRRKKRDVTYRAAPLDENLATAKTADLSERITKAEREAVMWAALEGIPETYREPLVLYYREGESIRNVAEALDLTEECVKQRLTRGRAKLKEELAAFVEESLGRTGPNRAFTAGVVTAICAGSTKQAAAVAVGAAAGKGASGALGVFLGPVIGILGGVYGAWSDYRKAESPRERRLVVILASVLFAYLLAMLALFPAIGWVADRSGLTYGDLVGGWIGLLAGGSGAIAGIGMGRLRRARLAALGIDLPRNSGPMLVEADWKTASGEYASSPLRTALAVVGGLSLLGVFIAGWIAVEYDVISLSALRGAAGRAWLHVGMTLGALLAGGLVALWMGTNRKYHPRARRFYAFWTGALFAFVAVWFAAAPFTMSVGWARNLSTVVYAAGVIALVGFGNRRIASLRQAGQLYAAEGRTELPVDGPRRVSRGAALGNGYGAFAGAVCWMVVLAVMVQDWFTVAALAVAVAAVPAASLKLFGPHYWRIVLADIAAAALLSLATVNLRWGAWMAEYRSSRFYEPINDQPLWAMNLLLGTLFGVLIAAVAFKARRERKAGEATGAKETGQ